MPFFIFVCTTVQCSLHSAGKGWIYKYASASREGFFPFQDGSLPTSSEGEWISGRWSPGGLEEKWRRNFYFSTRLLISNICVIIGGRVYWQEAFDFSLLSGWKSQVLIWKVKVNPDSLLSQVVHVFLYLSSFCAFYHQYLIRSRLAWKCSSAKYTKFRKTAFSCSKKRYST